MMQAVGSAYSAADLSRLKQAYAAAIRLMDGFYRAQDSPFLCHVTRTASIAMAHGASVDTVLVSLLHAVYMFGGFRDRKIGGMTAAHQNEIREAVGEKVERLIADYTKIEIHNVDFLKNRLENHASLSSDERDILLIALANELEDFLDLQMDFRRGAHNREMIEIAGDLMVRLANALEHSELAAELRGAFEKSIANTVPDAVKCGRLGAYELPEHYFMRRTRFRIFLSKVKYTILRREWRG
jgi:(p)ppGpp synthase/HD superfamily hydrolase